MGQYFALYDHTDKKELHVKYHVKKGPTLLNEIVHKAYINYMFEHPTHKFSLVGDNHPYYDKLEELDYKDFDLKEYTFENAEINRLINTLE